MVPSSPKRPCRALNTTSGFAFARSPATLGVTSISVTLYPSSRRALAHAAPETSDTSRSADHPPFRTATCLETIFLRTFLQRQQPFIQLVAEIQSIIIKMIDVFHGKRSGNRYYQRRIYLNRPRLFTLFDE